jgi:hypothetical protein
MVMLTVKRRQLFVTALAALLSLGVGETAEPDKTALDSCSFSVTTKEFDRATHLLECYSDGETLVKIDGQPYSGTDGTVPRREISSISLIMDGQTYALPQESFADIFEPHKDCATVCRFVCDPTGPELELVGGDGAGAYGASWLVKPSDGTVVRKVWEHPERDTPKTKRFSLAERVGEEPPNKSLERTSGLAPCRRSTPGR